MTDTKDLFARFHDRIIAVVVLVLLLFSLLYLAFKGMDVQTSLKEDKASFDPPTEKSTKLEKTLQGDVNLMTSKIKETQTATAKIKLKVPELRKSENDTQPEDLFTPNAMSLCEKCRLPIKMSAKTCTHCKASQTLLAKNEKLDFSNVDTDGDGMLDKWELQYGLNPNAPEDAELDLDADGFSNLVECKEGTNPKDAKSHPEYKDYATLVNLEKKYLLLRVVETALGGLGVDENGKTVNLKALTFVEVSEDGTTKRTFSRQLPGARIADTCYRYQTYNEKPSTALEYETKIKDASSTQVATMLVNQSTTLVTVMSDAAIETYDKYLKAIEDLKGVKNSPEYGHNDPKAIKKAKALEAEIATLKKKDARFAKKERETKGTAYELAFYDEKYYADSKKKIRSDWVGEPLMGLSADINVDILPETLEIKGLTVGKTFEIKDEKYVVVEIDEDKEMIKIKCEKDNSTFRLLKK